MDPSRPALVDQGVLNGLGALGFRHAGRSGLDLGNKMNRVLAGLRQMHRVAHPRQPTLVAIAGLHILGTFKRRRILGPLRLRG